MLCSNAKCTRAFVSHRTLFLLFGGVRGAEGIHNNNNNNGALSVRLHSSRAPPIHLLLPPLKETGPREVKQPAQAHTARKWCSGDLNQSSPGPEPPVLMAVPPHLWSLQSPSKEGMRIWKACHQRQERRRECLATATVSRALCSLGGAQQWRTGLQGWKGDTSLKAARRGRPGWGRLARAHLPGPPSLASLCR